MARMTELLQNFPEINNGPTPSRLPGVLFFKETNHIPKRPMVYNPGLCIIVQGHKIGYLGDQKFRYDAKQYLVTSVTIPFECETFATAEDPLRGLYIDIDMAQLHELIGRIDTQPRADKAGERILPCGIGPAIMDEAMLDALTRLVKCLRAEAEAQILGPAIVREILYWALHGTQAPVLYSLAMHSGTFSQVARVLQVMQNDYAGKLEVEQLAKMAHLSVSAFHRAFKEITADSPLQYLKKIRLTKARDLMLQQSVKANMAADRVGYESASQFSREFKRYFGQSPAEMMRESRGMASR